MGGFDPPAGGSRASLAHIKLEKQTSPAHVQLCLKFIFLVETPGPAAVMLGLRSAVFRAVTPLSRVLACRFSAAPIPVPNTQPEVHYNKVNGREPARLQVTFLLCCEKKCVTISV